jgi:uncharacterized lipoprotein YmbA
MKAKVDRRGTKHVNPDSGSKHQASHVWHRLSTRGYPVSGIRNPVSGLCLLSSLLWLLTSCNLPLPNAKSDQTRYYLLASAEIRPETDAAAALKRWVVGLRAVDVAAYLRTKSFAVRSQANEIAFLDFARWGEPLDQGIARVLAENLRSLKNVARVSLQPFRADDQLDFEVVVSVTACEGTADGDVRFAATWRIPVPGGSAAAAAEGSYAATGLRWDGHNCGQLAARLSEALAGLGRDIAAALPKELAK